MSLLNVSFGPPLVAISDKANRLSPYEMLLFACSCSFVGDPMSDRNVLDARGELGLDRWRALYSENGILVKNQNLVNFFGLIEFSVHNLHFLSKI